MSYPNDGNAGGVIPRRYSATIKSVTTTKIASASHRYLAASSNRVPETQAPKSTNIAENQTTDTASSPPKYTNASANLPGYNAHQDLTPFTYAKVPRKTALRINATPSARSFTDLSVSCSETYPAYPIPKSRASNTAPSTRYHRFSRYIGLIALALALFGIDLSEDNWYLGAAIMAGGVSFLALVPVLEKLGRFPSSGISLSIGAGAKSDSASSQGSG